jgi:hypothetical protein
VVSKEVFSSWIYFFHGKEEKHIQNFCQKKLIENRDKLVDLKIDGRKYNTNIMLDTAQLLRYV